MKVLFLNSAITNCGVYQYGYRLANILKKSKHMTFEYKEVSCYDDYLNILQKNSYDVIFYNYHILPLYWLNENTIIRTQQNIGILHDCPSSFFDKVISPDPDESINNFFGVPRPLLEEFSNDKSDNQDFENFLDINEEGVPIFGSFGFGLLNKGFHRMIEIINNQYEKAIIKLLITRGHYVEYHHTIDALNACNQVQRKDGIQLFIYETFIDDNSLMRFLSSNTMNIFLYDTMHGRGISSCIDFALSAKKPIGISDSNMFKNIYNDSICVYKNNIEVCMKNSIPHCQELIKKYSHENLINRFEEIINL